MATNARAVPVTMAATVEQMETQYRLWGARIGELEAAGESRRVQAKLDRHKRIEDLKSQHRLARVKIDELKAAGVERWQDHRAGVETVGKKLESSLHRVDRQTGKTTNLVWVAALVLVVLWLAAVVTANTLGGYVHVLLLPALGIVAMRLIRLRRVA